MTTRNRRQVGIARRGEPLSWVAQRRQRPEKRPSVLGAPAPIQASGERSSAPPWQRVPLNYVSSFGVDGPDEDGTVHCRMVDGSAATTGPARRPKTTMAFWFFLLPGLTRLHLVQQ